MTLNLTQALEMGLTAQPDNWQEDVLHVTDLAVAIGETCPRQLQLRLKGADRRLPPPGQQMMFRHGQRIHEDLVTLLMAGLPYEWSVVYVELPVELDDITGRIDCVIEHLPSGDKFIVDFKTIRGRAFNWLEGPKPAHVLQVQSYMVAFEQSTGIKPVEAYVLYVDREGQNSFKQFAVGHDKNRVLDAVVQTQAIANSPLCPELQPKIEVKENKGPDSVKLKQPWNCDYCDYQDVSCHGALPNKLRDLGIVGYIDGAGFTPKDGVPAEAVKIVEGLLELEKIPF